MAIPGDIDGDGNLSTTDIEVLSAQIASASYQPLSDLNGDGVVDLADHDHWVTVIANTWLGDANFDGTFDEGDFFQVLIEGRYNTGLIASWAGGDWNADLVFDINDRIAASVAGGFREPGGGAGPSPRPDSIFEAFGETPPHGVPDGGTTALLSLVALGAVGGMRRLIS